MFLSPDVRAVLCSSRYIPQFLGFWSMNICLFPVVNSANLNLLFSWGYIELVVSSVRWMKY
jgi:hypothetical protein